jgi:hypothetical protein
LWGGVTRNGGRLDLGYTAASTTYFIWGGWYALVGTGVARNQQAIGGVGMEWTLLESPTLFVGAGLSATALGYQHNLRFYTLGQGGYFSPQAFVNAGVPLRIRGSLGKAHFEATAAPALNWFNEWTSPYFPLDPAQQAQRAQEVDSTGKSLQAFYPERTSTAFGFDLDARLSWQIAAPLEGGLSLVAHRGDDYSEVIGGLFLRVSFNGRTSAAELPPLRPGTSP